MPSRPAVLTVLALCALAPCLCCRRKEPAQPERRTDLVAEVGGTEIPLQAFVDAAARRHAQGLVAKDASAFLQELIDREVLIQRARELGFDRDPEVKRVYENLLIGRLRAAQLAPKLESIAIPDSEVQSYYQAHLAEFRIAPKVRVAVLRRRVPQGREESVVADLEEARDEAAGLESGTLGFGPLSIRHSEDQASRYRGGDIGWVNIERGHRRCPRELIEAVFGLGQAGDMTPVIVLGSDAYLARLIDRKPGGSKPLQDVESIIRRRLLEQKRETLEQAFIAEHRAHVPVEVFPDGLERAADAVGKSDRAKAEPDGPPGLP